MVKAFSVLFTLSACAWAGPADQCVGDSCPGEFAEEFSTLQTKATNAEVHELETIKREDAAMTPLRCTGDGENPTASGSRIDCCPGLQYCTGDKGRGGYYIGCYRPGAEKPFDKDGVEGNCEAMVPFATGLRESMKTGGTCRVLDCDSSRHARCVDGECVCDQGYASGGQCPLP